MGIHDGHRNRLRKQFLVGGLDSFSDVQVLEFLLMHTIPRRDVNPLAHRLLAHFGSLSGVLDASPADLGQVDGIGAGTAAFLAMLPQLQQRCEKDRGRSPVILSDIAAAGRYLLPYFAVARTECVYMLCLDAKCKLLDCRMVFEGSINVVSISVRKIVEVALQQRATSVILAHNHTAGIAIPSREDMITTQKIRQALELVDILLADHLIVADGDFVSMQSSGPLVW